MLEVKLYDNDEKEYGIYYFEDTSELLDYLYKHNVTLVYEKEI